MPAYEYTKENLLRIYRHAYQRIKFGVEANKITVVHRLVYEGCLLAHALYSICLACVYAEVLMTIS